MSEKTSLTLDYALSQAVQIPHSLTIKLISGYLFPSSDSISYAIVDFGDGNIENIYLPERPTYAEADILSKVENFFPNWKETIFDNAACMVPKFRTSHTYLVGGVYNIKTTLVSNVGIQYIGQAYNINVSADEYVNLYNSLSEIDAEYELIVITDNTFDLIGIDDNGSTPFIRVFPYNDEIAPIVVTLNVFGIEGRTDIDYIYWEFSDGTKILKDNTDPFYHEFYKLPFNGVTSTVTATIYITRLLEGIEYKYKCIETDFNNFNSTTGIGQSKVFDDGSQPRKFSMYPAYSYTLPVEATFYHEVTSNLEYIISNFSDGSYTVTPTAYDFLTPNEVQIVTVAHTYETVNTYRFNPKCIYVYKSDTGECYYREAALATNLFYDLGIVNPTGNFLLEPITSSTNFRKFNNISTLTNYPTSAVADISVRLDVGLEPNNILNFSKIIWTFKYFDTEFEIIQDKETSKTFGTLSNVEIDINSSSFIVTADLYRSDILNLSDPYQPYGTYSTGPFDILSLSASLVTNQDIAQTYVSSLNIDNNSILPELVTYNGLVEAGQSVTPEIELLEYSLAFDGRDGELFYQSSIVDFDLLFTAINPAANFLNHENPSTATTPSGLLASKLDIGFFKPSKTAIVVVDPGVFTFTISASNVDFFTPIYLPDPNIYGSETAGFTFKINNNSFIRDISLGLAAFEPITNKDCVTFNGYNSNNAPQRTIDLATLEFITTPGALSDRKRDIYGNTFSLIDTNSNFTSNVTIGTNTSPYTTIVNASSTQPNTARDSTGLTTYTTQATANQNILTRNKQAKLLAITSLTNDTYSISQALGYGAIKYPSTVWAQLTSNLIYSCDIIYDVFFIETLNYIIIDRLKVSDNQFINPQTSNLIVTKGLSATTNNFLHFSNRYKKDNYVYFAQLSTVGEALPLSANGFAVFPIIYRFDYSSFSILQIYPLASDTAGKLLSAFSFQNTTVQYVEASSPKLTYLSKTDTFNISFLLKDLNKSPYIVSANFKDRNTAIFTDTYGIKIAKYNYSNTFTSNNSITSYTWLLTASTPIIGSNALAL